MQPAKFEKLIPYDAAYMILDAYINFYHQSKRITKRAKIRFERRDWSGVQQDARERISLYREAVGNAVIDLLEFLGDRSHDRVIWHQIKEMYLEEIFNFNTRNIAETFYNSVFRHSHKGLSVDEDQMFVHATGTYREFRSTLPIFHTFFLTRPLNAAIQQIFNYYTWDVPMEDIERDIGFVTEILESRLLEGKHISRMSRIEVLKSVFYRNKGAYLVGRLVLDDGVHPFVLPLLHEEKGIYVDALLLEYNDVSSIFSYNRTYFLVDTDIASEMVDFLRTILPTKSMGELYNSIGFEKHGKTVLYRDFLRHLERSVDRFERAPGIEGMVMAVFHLPSFPMVFKVIKDHFPPPKKVTEAEVKKKYEIVSMHDRVGRMADSHMFENFVFERVRFKEELVEELLRQAPSKIRVRDDTIEIKHMYIEKKMVPLNLFLENANLEEAEEVIIEYGNAIKQMAAVNIFPGDMLLKNFGVTRLRRVVFYDYDEIGYLTDYNFRRIPEAERYEDELSNEPWYSVGPDDVFPEEFARFLIGRRDIQKIFLTRHADLFQPNFWIEMQKRLQDGQILDVFPYRRRLRFNYIFGDGISHSNNFDPD